MPEVVPSCTHYPCTKSAEYKIEYEEGDYSQDYCCKDHRMCFMDGETNSITFIKLGSDQMQEVILPRCYFASCTKDARHIVIGGVWEEEPVKTCSDHLEQYTKRSGSYTVTTLQP